MQDSTKRFACDCMLKGETFKGYGKTKKEAKTESARLAFWKFCNLGEQEYTPETGLNLNMPLFVCPLCSKCFTSIPDLKSHLQSFHSVPDERLPGLMEMVETKQVSEVAEGMEDTAMKAVS